MKESLSAIRITLVITSVFIIANFSVNSAPPHPQVSANIKLGQIKVPYYIENIDELHQQGVCAPDQFLKNLIPLHLEFQSDSLPTLFRVLAVLVKFSDHNSYVAPQFFDSIVFSTNGTSVTDYVSEVTYGQIDMVTVDFPSSLGWRLAPQSYSYYVNQQNGLGAYPRNTQKLVEDLVDQIDPLVDFSLYDNDGNGFVDVLLVIHSGTGAEFTGSINDIWSHKWAITPRVKDGVMISSYTAQPEFWTNPGDMTIGIYAHELFHGFGLPDLFDTDQSSNGIGRWGLMAYGCWNGPGGRGVSPSHPCAWSRIKIGATSSIDVSAELTNVTLESVFESGQIYRLWKCGQSGPEYFLIENRQRLGYDTHQLNSGLLVWHVDELKPNNTQEWYPGLSGVRHYKVALEQADGLFDLDKDNDQGDASDPFPGSWNKTVFDISSTPNSDSYTNGPTYVRVDNIDTSGLDINLDMSVGLYGCCCGIHGDANGDGQEGNMIDLTFLSDYIFKFSGNPGACFSESDMNGDGIGPNILDLTYLVDRIFRGGPQFPLCS